MYNVYWIQGTALPYTLCDRKFSRPRTVGYERPARSSVKCLNTLEEVRLILVVYDHRIEDIPIDSSISLLKSDKQLDSVTHSR